MYKWLTRKYVKDGFVVNPLDKININFRFAFLIVILSYNNINKNMLKNKGCRSIGFNKNM